MIRFARTPRALSIELGFPVSLIQFVIESNPDIQPVCRADGIPIFDAPEVARIRHEANKLMAVASSEGESNER